MSARHMQVLMPPLMVLLDLLGLLKDLASKGPHMTMLSQMTAQTSLQSGLASLPASLIALLFKAFDSSMQGFCRLVMMP